MRHISFVVSLVCLLLHVSSDKEPSPAAGALSPIILFPGFAGNKLHAEIDSWQTFPWYCRNLISNKVLLWVNVKFFLYPMSNCIDHFMKLQFDPITKTTSNAPGVNTVVKGFGTIESVDFLTRVPIISYFSPLIKALESKLGYRRDISIRGAPFDFRRAPNEHAAYFNSVRALIEMTYHQNGQQRVTLVGHSMGCLMAYEFLKHYASPAWKSKYIEVYVNVVGPFKGSVKSLLAIASGEDFDVPIVKRLWFRNAIRSFPTSYYLLPSPESWTESEVLAATDKRNYTVHDYKDFLNDIGDPQGWPMYQAMRAQTNFSRHPGVRTVCVNSQDILTHEMLDWRGKSFPDKYPKIHHTDGDGTVTKISMDQCMDWAKDTSGPKISTKVFRGAEHLKILKDDQFLDYMVKNIKEKFQNN